MAANLSALLNESKALTSHLARPDLPSVHLGLDQIEALSRRLGSRQPISGEDADKANYLLAQAHVDAPALGASIAHLNAGSTFAPRHALADTDVDGFLRLVREQNVIATIDEARRSTQADFYRLLEERTLADWEAKKKRVFEQLGSRLGSGGAGAAGALGRSQAGRTALHASTSTAALTPQVQAKMMAYETCVSDLNHARLRGTSYPIVHSLIQAALSVPSDPCSTQTAQTLHVLAKITQEPPALPPVEHAGAHILNTPLFARKLARAYLAPPAAAEAAALRAQIARGAREALEEQYWDVLERTLLARQVEAQLGGDPSVQNRVRAFVLLRHWRAGEWEDRIELVGGQPVWAKLFYLVRTGHGAEALDEAVRVQRALEGRDPGFVALFKAWLESGDRRLPRAARETLRAGYNAHQLRAGGADPFKLALYKLMGRVEPSRRSVPLATATTEDWLWFQLAMVDEEEQGLAALADVLLGYGEAHFDAQGKRRGVWAGVLVMCGQFERAVGALWEHPETEVEAVHLAIALAYHGLLRVPTKAEASDITILNAPPGTPPTLNLASMVWRYVRRFVERDAREALHYVCCAPLSADQPGDGGQAQLEAAWALVRRIIAQAAPGAAWEELVGGFRPDGTRFPGIVEQGAPLLALADTRAFHAEILARAAADAEDAGRVSAAVKLYDLAGEPGIVVGVLARALGAAPGGDAELERTARDVLRNYERTNRAPGRERDAVSRLLQVREAAAARDAGRPDVALALMERTGLVPLDGDVARVARRADEVAGLHDALQRNLPAYLTLTMDLVADMYARVKAARGTDNATLVTLDSLRQKSRSLLVFAGALKYRMAPDVYAHLAQRDVEICL